MNFTCPYCNHVTTITEPNLSDVGTRVQTCESKNRYLSIQHHAVACPNTECKMLTLSLKLVSHTSSDYLNRNSVILNSWNLLPRSLAKPQPDYIPIALREDYYEACAVLPHSAKASATLSRRCLQGIVRDFWQLPSNKRGKLAAELKLIKGDVDADTWAGIDAIVTVGNIGAHIENDVNYVVDVDQDEAELLIELIEMLLEDWYVSRQKRRDRANKARRAASKKIEEKRAAKKASLEAKKTEEGEK